MILLTPIWSNRSFDSVLPFAPVLNHPQLGLANLHPIAAFTSHTPLTKHTPHLLHPYIPG